MYECLLHCCTAVWWMANHHLTLLQGLYVHIKGESYGLILRIIFTYLNHINYDFSSYAFLTSTCFRNWCIVFFRKKVTYQYRKCNKYMAHPICQLQTLKLRIPPSYFLARLNFAPSVKMPWGKEILDVFTQFAIWLPPWLLVIKNLFCTSVK